MRSPYWANRLATFILLAAAAIELSGCITGTSLVTGRKRAYGYTWQQEIELGSQVDGQIIGEYGLYEDAELAQYVDSLGQYLLRFSQARSANSPEEVRNTPFTFRVLDSPVVNAFALPGGYIYVTRGLMAHLENEAQLAVVIGHEIGHVVGRHASIRAANQQFGQALLLGGAVGGEVLLGGGAGSAILEGGSMVAQLAFLSYGRDDERESDELGVEYAIQAGYDAHTAAEFFRTLKRLSGDSGNGIPSFLSTHPDPGEREATIHRRAAEWALTHPPGKEGRDEFLAQVDGIVAGENPRQGFTRDGVFYHPDLAFRFPVPAGHTVANGSSQVQIIAEDQASGIIFSIEEGVNTARAAAERFTATEGLTVVQSGLGSAYGLPAQYVVADVEQNDGILRVRSHYVQYQGLVYNFLGLAPQSAYAGREAGFIRTMQGFAPLRDPAILGAQPSRITVSPLASPSVFRTLVPASGVAGFSASELAILNQISLEDQLPAGRLVKLIQGN